MIVKKSFEDLVDQAFAGNNAAFDELHRMLYLYVYLMGGYFNAEDIVQETLVTVWMKWHTVNDSTRLKSWVLRIAHHKAIDQLRKEHKNVSLDTEEDFETSPIYEQMIVTHPDELPQIYLEQQENRQYVWKALAEMAEISRSCLILRLMQNVSAKEVARLHQCSVRQIERYVKQGKENFSIAYQRLLAEQPIIEGRIS